MKTEIVEPEVKNFVKSLRDVGYTFEIAVADILDNSITAGATHIDIYAVPEPELSFEIMDDGNGMDESELIEAMRLASKNPEDERDKDDLGRFGLGLKTASFSQCLCVTVVSKKQNIVSARQWDLEHIQQANRWELITPSNEDLAQLHFYERLLQSDGGTLVVWGKIDRQSPDSYVKTIIQASNHLSLVFHRFLEAKFGVRKVIISVNNRILKPFDPFNAAHKATQQIPEEKLKFYGSDVIVKAYILPHHSKLSQSDYERYATVDGYTKSQGFYLYRANRLLIYGTWWGLHQATDAHKLVRIQIDIPNNQDHLWGINIKKSTAKPVPELRDDLKRIIGQVTALGSRPYTGRGKKIEDRTTTHFWSLVRENGSIRFVVNEKHPIFALLEASLADEQSDLFRKYVKGLQAYIPLDAIQAQLQQNPYEVRQEQTLTEEDIEELAKNLIKMGLTKEQILSLLDTDIFKGRQELFVNGKEQL